MVIESDSPAIKNSMGGSSGAAAKSASTFFRNPGGEVVRASASNGNYQALARRLELVEMQLDTLQKDTSGGSIEEHIDLLMKENNEEGKTDIVPDKDSHTVEQFKLPSSAYSLLISSDICSLPSNTAFVALGFSLTCLISVLYYRISTINNPKNPFGLAVGVDPEVNVAKYVAITIAVLMENEIPTGLELIGKGAQQVPLPDGRRKFSMRRIIFSSLLRFTVGFLFLCLAFLVTVQQDAVLTIFYSVLGLSFVETLDDVIFAVAARGFFGQRLLKATNLPSMDISSATHKHNFTKWSMRSIKLVYFLNLCVGYAGLTYLATRQANGQYRCSKFLVQFGDELWEGAHTNFNGKAEDRLLIYSHFNGIYEEDGTHDGRPRYVERNKENGGVFSQEVIPAEIVYCNKIEAWVFRHANIRTSLDSETENACSWLMKSQRAPYSYDITSMSSWSVWTGVIENQPSVSIKCAECSGKSSCNFNGQCVDYKCVCREDIFGDSCQFSKPCNVIRSEKDYNTTLELLSSSVDGGTAFFESYGRPMYVIRNMTGKPNSLLRFGFPDVGTEYFEIEYPEDEGNEGDVPLHKHYEPNFFLDDDFFQQNVVEEILDKNYTFVLQYTGRRWYGGLYSSAMTEDVFKEGRYHGFWDNVFSNVGAEDKSTFLISAPTFGGSPIGLDFYEMRRRNIPEDFIHKHAYDPFGMLIPLIAYEGSSFFNCNADAED